MHKSHHLWDYMPIPLGDSRLDVGSLRIIFYADASFDKNADFSLHLGYILLLTDNSARANPIH